MWYAKMYFSAKKEVFQFDSHGVQGVPSTYRERPFLESLLTFLEMAGPELELSTERHRVAKLLREQESPA